VSVDLNIDWPVGKLGQKARHPCDLHAALGPVRCMAFLGLTGGVDALTPLGALRMVEAGMAEAVGQSPPLPSEAVQNGSPSGLQESTVK
jgi:hypothetical protein